MSPVWTPGYVETRKSFFPPKPEPLETGSPLSAETLTFENAHALSELYNADESLLRETEKSLGAKITARDAMLKIDGAAQAHIGAEPDRLSLGPERAGQAA